MTAEDGVPVCLGSVAVARVREEWRVAERWWTQRPLERRYFDVVLESGENVVIFCDELAGGWYRQRA